MKNVMLAVLAGGAGSRMGRPKGELRVRGLPILQYLLERWDWEGPTVLVTAPGREKPPGFVLFDREVRDAASGEGPLRGIVTALDSCEAAKVIVVATCDMPLVTRGMMESLVRALIEDASHVGVMTRRGDVIEPFPMALRAGAVEMLRERLARGERSLQSLENVDGFTCIDAPSDPHVWMNLNDPEDYARFVAGAL